MMPQLEKRQAGVKVTPEMIEAGVACLMESLDDRLPPSWPLAELVVADLWDRMDSVRRESCREVHKRSLRNFESDSGG